MQSNCYEDPEFEQKILNRFLLHQLFIHGRVEFHESNYEYDRANALDFSQFDTPLNENHTDHVYCVYCLKHLGTLLDDAVGTPLSCKTCGKVNNIYWADKGLHALKRYKKYSSVFRMHNYLIEKIHQMNPRKGTWHNLL